MRHVVKLSGITVGYSDLEQTDKSLQRAWGAFRPGLGYDLVQPVFQLFADAVPPGGLKDSEKLERYYKARDALPLELEDAAGRVIRTSAIHIADYSRAVKPSMELDVLISDDAYWKSR